MGLLLDPSIAFDYLLRALPNFSQIVHPEKNWEIVMMMIIIDMSENPREEGASKRRRLNADAVIRKAEAKLEKAKAEKLTEVLHEVKVAVNGAGIDFHARDWRVVEREKEKDVPPGPSYEIFFLPTERSFSSVAEATAYLEREGDEEGVRADLLAAFLAKLTEHGDNSVMNSTAWRIEWFEGSIVYQYTEGHQPTFASEAEAIEFAFRGYTSRDEEIANEFAATLLECDSMIGQVSALLADGLKNLKNASGAGDSASHAEDAMPLNVVSGEYIADEENDDDDEDYSSCSLSDDISDG